MKYMCSVVFCMTKHTHLVEITNTGGNEQDYP